MIAARYTSSSYHPEAFNNYIPPFIDYMKDKKKNESSKQAVVYARTVVKTQELLKQLHIFSSSPLGNSTQNDDTKRQHKENGLPANSSGNGYFGGGFGAGSSLVPVGGDSGEYCVFFVGYGSECLRAH